MQVVNYYARLYKDQKTVELAKKRYSTTLQEFAD
jgi:hypothetical protein